MNNTSNKIKTMTTIALLSAIGILVPQIMPGILIGPASYTLASHVAVILAMFISPVASIIVALITALGFFMRGFDLVIVCRALSHIVFVTVGAFILMKNPKTLQTAKSLALFGILISLIHSICEVLVVSVFTLPGAFTTSKLLFIGIAIGLGTIVHSLIDFSIAVVVWIPVQRFVSIPANAKIRLQTK